MYSKMGMDGFLGAGPARQSGTPETSPRLQLSRLLKSICGEFANPRTTPEDVPVRRIQPFVLAKSRFVPRAEMAFRRPRADHCQFPAAAPDPSARAGRAAGRSCPRSEGALLGLLATAEPFCRAHRRGGARSGRFVRVTVHDGSRAQRSCRRDERGADEPAELRRHGSLRADALQLELVGRRCGGGPKFG